MKLSIPTYTEYHAPNSLPGFIRLLRKLAPRGWRLNGKGRLACKEGFCVMGRLIQSVNPGDDTNKFPEPGEAAVELAIPGALAERIMRANDGVDTDTEPKHFRRFFKDRAILLGELGVKDNVKWEARIQFLKARWKRINGD